MSFWIGIVLGWLSIGLLNTTAAQNEPTGPPPSLPTLPPNQPAELPDPPAQPHPPLPPPPHSKSKGSLNYAGSDDDDMKTEHILAMVLPLVIFTLVIACAAIGIYYMMNRARYGAFCCFNPRSNYRIQPSEPKDESTDRELGDLAAPRSGTPPPDYTPSTIGPPVYQDALHDVIVQTDDVYSIGITTHSDSIAFTRPSDNTSTDDTTSTDRLLAVQPPQSGNSETLSS